MAALSDKTQPSSARRSRGAPRQIAVVGLLALAFAAGSFVRADAMPPQTQPQGFKEAVLRGVSFDSADDGWAVGTDISGDKTLVKHWDGLAWTRLKSPSFGAGDNQLNGVVALSPDDVWAVGSYNVSSTEQEVKPLTLHWDGSTWTKVPSPAPGGRGVLTAVSAAGPDDIWAVGTEYHLKRLQHLSKSLTLHWDGSTWTRVPSPNLTNHIWGTRLRAVTVLAPDDAWALGGDFYSFQTGALYLHWNGVKWSRVSPPAGDRLACAGGLGGTDASHVWAVGGTKQRSLIQAWDGSSWQDQSEWPAGRFASVAALTASDAWAVGYNGGCDSGISGVAIAKHWDGSDWQSVEVAVPEGTSVLLSVAMLATDDVWAVGWASGRTYHPLIEHWDGAAWSVVSPAARPR